VLLGLLLRTLLGVVGLVIDGGLMMTEYRSLQHAADAAATAAAMRLNLGKSPNVAVATAVEVVHDGHGLPHASVTVNIPPSSGPYAGQANHVEVIVERAYSTHFMKVLDNILARPMCARAVACAKSGPAGAAIVVLDPDQIGRAHV